MFGFLNINKPEKLTSHDVVSRLRKVLDIKQIGHTGTLDPFAVGVLPICIGKSTRLIEYLDDDKAYIATVQLGANTDSYDIDGLVTEKFDKKITKDELLCTLRNFEGEISQLPPIYSAIKVKGKKLYEYAREGKTVNITPRKVFIQQISLKSFDKEKQTATIYIKCSKGTYIRSIAYDIGKNLGCGGYLSALKRIQAGNFNIENSINLEDVRTKNDVERYLINPLDILNLPKIEVNQQGYEKIKFGQMLNSNDLLTQVNDELDLVILVYNKKEKVLCAIAQLTKDGIKVKKGFL